MRWLAGNTWARGVNSIELNHGRDANGGLHSRGWFPKRPGEQQEAQQGGDRPGAGRGEIGRPGSALGAGVGDLLLDFLELLISHGRLAPGSAGGIDPPLDPFPEPVVALAPPVQVGLLQSKSGPVGRLAERVVHATAGLEPQVDGLQSHLLIAGPEQSVQVRMGFVAGFLEPAQAGGLVVELPVGGVPPWPLLASPGLALNALGDGWPGEARGSQLGRLGEKGLQVLTHGEAPDGGRGRKLPACQLRGTWPRDERRASPGFKATTCWQHVATKNSESGFAPPEVLAGPVGDETTGCGNGAKRQPNRRYDPVGRCQMNLNRITSIVTSPE